MKPSPAAQLTIEDLAIWVGLNLTWTMHRTPGWARLDAQESDRRDAELMLALAECRRDIGGGSKAMAHRMLGGSTNRTDAMFVNGFWVNLA
jgi:hypothetical protein